MFDKIDLFTLSQTAARHAAARQGVIAQNVANADTPGYAARDLASFADSYDSAASIPMRQTRAGHLGDDAPDLKLMPELRHDAMSPNGNTVSLEAEMVKSVDAKRDHDLALAIYKTSLGILRTSLGRR